MYSLIYYNQQGRKLETVFSNLPLALCRWKMNQLKATTHRQGVLIIEKI